VQIPLIKGIATTGLNVEPNVGDDVLVELLGRAVERYEGGLTAYGPPDFQLRIARVAGAHHLTVSLLPVQLSDHDDRQIELFGERLYSSRDLGDFQLPIFLSPSAR
jgi:hypothetical protein